MHADEEVFTHKTRTDLGIVNPCVNCKQFFCAEGVVDGAHGEGCELLRGTMHDRQRRVYSRCIPHVADSSLGQRHGYYLHQLRSVAFLRHQNLCHIIKTSAAV